jgi:hypothetical protein
MKRLKQFFFGFLGLSIVYLLLYVGLRLTGNLVIWDYGTEKPEIKTSTGENPVCLLGIIYYPLMLIEWYHPRFHDALTPN